MSTIGSRICKRRKELKMTQQELAEKAGYQSRSSINKIEIQDRDLPQSKILAIANALQTTPTYIMGWEEETTTPHPTDTNPTDTIAKHYGIPAANTVEKLLKLDQTDRERIDERIDTMLESDKYKKPAARAV